MKKRILAAFICAAALTAAGCAGQEAGTPAEETETKETVEAEAPAAASTEAEAAAGDTASAASTAEETAKESAPEAAGEKYESEDGWSVRYNSDLVEAEETGDGVLFTYTGECSGTNSIRISYIPNTSTDIVLADKMADHENDQIERSEGYWGGRTDIWAFSADVIPEWNATLGYTAVEYDGGVLLVEKRGYKESDEELGAQITDTMAAITDSFEFNEFKPQTEYDYMPGKYTLNAESAGTGEAGDAGKESGSAGSGGEAGSTGSYPAEILLREDHTGTIRGQETTDITWYSRDNLIKENKPGGNTYYFSIEGDYLYLQQGEGYVEYVKDTTGGAAQEIKAQSGPGGSDKESGGPAGFATYESEEGWLVYYDKDVIDVSEKRGEVDFAFAGGGEDTDMLRFQYLRYDSTEEALRDAGGVYDLSTLAVSEGFLGGRRDAWGFTITMPDDSETERTFTAVEHNGGSLLIERIIDAARSEEEKAEVNKALDDLLNTFMFTRHDPQTEFEDVPGTYLINDKILQKDASNYPSAVRLNSDHTGVFKGSPDVEIIWHARDGIIREAAPDGASYEYRLDDDTLYLMMDGEQVEFNREDTEEDW